jgi:hypothetical protein
MAIKLTQGADATIATAAARAGMAGVPLDMSKSFEQMSKSQIDLMNVYAKQGAELINTTLEIAAPLVKEAAERLKTKMGFGGNENMVQPISEQWKAHRKNKPKRRDYRNDDESFDKDAFRKDKDAWDSKKNKILNDGQYARNGIQKSLQQVAIDDMDPLATGSENLLWHGTITAQGDPIKTGKHKGLYSETGYRDDELGFYMKTSDGKYISEIDELGRITTTDKKEQALWKDHRDVENLIVPKQTELIQAVDALSAGFQDHGEKTGKEATTTMLNLAKKKTREAVATENGWKALTKNRGLAGSDISYFDAISGDDIELSSEILNLVTLKTEGFKDDGDGKITAKDFAGEDGIFSEEDLKDVTILANMNILRREAMNYNNPQAKEAFLAWTDKQFKKANKDGIGLYEKKNPRNPSNRRAFQFGIDPDRNYGSIYLDNKTNQVFGDDIINEVKLFKDIENGKMGENYTFRAYTGITFNWTGKNWQRVEIKDGKPEYKNVSRRAVINSYGSDFNTKGIMDYLGEGPKINNTFNTDPNDKDSSNIEKEKEKEKDEKKEEEKKGGFSFFKKQF